MKSVRNIVLFLIVSLLSILAYASIVTTETPLNVKAVVTNAITPWYYINTDNAGVAISVTSGSCKIEIAFESMSSCKDNTAIGFDWDGVSSVVTSGNKKFMSVNGVSCVRADCTAGTGTFLLRRH